MLLTLRVGFAKRLERIGIALRKFTLLLPLTLLAFPFTGKLLGDVVVLA
jgi:hypothetical protein